MKKEQLFPLIVGLVLGIILMFFWQLGARLNSQSSRLTQLEEAAAVNNQTIHEIINFINSATAPQDMPTDMDFPMGEPMME